MKKVGISLFWILFALVLFPKSNFTFEHRSKRTLIFPPADSQQIDVIIGLGLPVDLKLESVTMGISMSTHFKTPSNVSRLWSHLEHPFDVLDQSSRKRSIRKSRIRELNENYNEKREYNFQKYSTESNVFEHNQNRKANHLGSMRWTVYKALAEIAERYGFTGRSCVLRSICESAQISIDYSSGILGELFHVIMSPSVTNEDIINHEDNEYLYAESMGQNGEPCNRIFNECKQSLLDIFTKMDTTIFH